MNIKVDKDSLISIITPMYNSEKFIPLCIESVLAQTYKNWELLVVYDSGTNDSSPDIVKKYSNMDSRVKLIKVPNGKGLSLSRNYAIQKSNGRFLAFLDSDDLWLESKLEKQIYFMKQNRCALSCHGFRRINSDGNTIGRKISVPYNITYKRLLQQNCLGCLTVMIDLDKTGKIQFIETKHEDFILWLRLLREGHKCLGINEDLGRYRIVENSRSADKFESVKNTWRIYREFEGLSLPHAALRLSQFSIRNLIKYSRF